MVCLKLSFLDLGCFSDLVFGRDRCRLVNYELFLGFQICACEEVIVNIFGEDIYCGLEYYCFWECLSPAIHLNRKFLLFLM